MTSLNVSATHPRVVPAAYSGCAILRDAYERGWSHGHGLACHNVPRIGATYWLEAEGRVRCDEDNAHEVHAMLCHAAADHARCYSPFEDTAQELNRYGEGGWFALQDGAEPVGPFEAREEAEGAVDADEWELVEWPSSETVWEAFEEGTRDAIAADLVGYDLRDYGAKDAA
jgi:hypothetical protein